MQLMNLELSFVFGSFNKPRIFNLTVASTHGIQPYFLWLIGFEKPPNKVTNGRFEYCR